MDADYDVYCGIDVGKWSHHLYGIDRVTGEVVFDGKVSQGEKPIREAFASLGDNALIVVDQPGSMSSLVFAIARDMGFGLGFLTPMAMSKAIDMYGGAKTDARDAMVIAEVACGIPKLVKPIDERTPARHKLAALMSHDESLAADATRSSNRLHDLVLSVCPPMEECLCGKKIQSTLYLEVLARYGGPMGIKRAGRSRIRKWILSKKGFGRASADKVDVLVDAALSQTVAIPGGNDIEALIASEARRLLAILEARKDVAGRRDEALAGLPEAEVLMSMPGNGAITAATFIAEVGDASSFPSAAKLASYAGLSPRVRQSGTSVNSVSKPHGGNRRLKRVLVLSASKSILFCDESRKYYERKRAEGKCYKAAVTALARKRLDVMYAMLRDGKKYSK